MRHRALGTALEIAVPLAILALWAVLSADSEISFES